MEVETLESSVDGGAQEMRRRGLDGNGIILKSKVDRGNMVGGIWGTPK